MTCNETSWMEREAERMVADEINAARKMAADLYATGVGRLSGDRRRFLHLGMSAFRGGDWTELAHWDEIAEIVAREFPALFPADCRPEERLFELFAAGAVEVESDESDHEANAMIAVALVDLAGMSYAAAAEHVGCPQSTLSGRLRAGRRLVRERLGF